MSDDLTLQFNVDVELATTKILDQAVVVEKVLEESAKRATTEANRQFAKLGVESLNALVNRASSAFTSVVTQSKGASDRARKDTVKDLQATLAAVTELSRQSTQVLKAQLEEDSRLRRAAADQAARDVANASKVATATTLEQLKTTERAKREEAAATTAELRAQAIEAAKSQGQADRLAASEAVRLREQTAADLRRVDAQERSDRLREEAKTQEALRNLNRSNAAEFRANAQLELEAQRAGNNLELAEERGHQFRRSEVVKRALQFLANEQKNFITKHRQEQRNADVLEHIEEQRKATESIETVKSSLRQQEELTRGALARTAASERAQTITSRGVTGAVAGRSSIGIGLRNLAFIGGGIFSIKNTLDIGQEFAQTIAVVGEAAHLTADQLEAVRKKSIELGNDIALPGVSAKEGAQAIGLMAQSGIDLNLALDGAARASLTLARAAGVDVKDAVQIVDDSINVFRLSGKDAQRTVDDLAGSIKIAGGETIPELADAFKSASAVFQSTFQNAADGATNFRELNAAVDLLGKNGVRGETAGTAIRNALVRLTNPTKAGNAALEQIAKTAGVTGGVLFDVSGKTRKFSDVVDILSRGMKGFATEEQRSSAFVDIFGAKSQIAARLLTEQTDVFKQNIAILAAGETVYTKTGLAIQKQGAAAKLAAAQNSGLKGAIDALVSQFQTFQIELFLLVNNPGRTVILGIATAIDKLANDSKFTAIRKGLVGIAIAAGGLLILKTVAEGIQLTSAAVTILATSPLLLAATGVLGIAFAIGFFAAKNKEFARELQLFKDQLIATGALIVRELKVGHFKEAKDLLFEFVTSLGDFPLVQHLGRLIATAAVEVKDRAVALGKTIAGSVVDGFNEVRSLGPTVLHAIEDGVLNAVDTARSLGRTILAKIGDGIEFAQENRIPQRIGALILQGIAEAGKLLALALTNRITIDVVAGIAAGLAAGAVIIVGAFVKGFIAGLIQNRGQIAQALGDILRFAVSIALPALLSAIKSSPIWVQLLAFFGTVFIGAKLFTGLLDGLKGFQVNARSALLALNGDFQGSRAVVADYQKSLRTVRVGELDAFGSALPGIGRAINQNVTTPLRNAVAAFDRFASVSALSTGVKAPIFSQTPLGPFPTTQQLRIPFTPNLPGGPTTGQLQFPGFSEPALGQQQLFPTIAERPIFPTVPSIDNQAIINQQIAERDAREKATAATRDEIEQQGKADTAARLAAVGVGVLVAALSGYAIGATTGASRSIAFVSALGGIAAAAAAGGPPAAALATGATLLAAAFGAHAKKAQEAKDRIKEWTEVVKNSDREAARAEAIATLGKKFEDGNDGAKKFANTLKGNFADLVDAINQGDDATKNYLLHLRDGARAAGASNFDIAKGLQFALDEAKAKGVAVTAQTVLNGLISNAASKQKDVTKQAQDEAKARNDSLVAQRDLLGLLSSIPTQTNNITLGFAELKTKIAEALNFKGSQAEAATLGFQLDNLKRQLADDLVNAAKDAATAAAALGDDPRIAVNNLRDTIRDNLVKELGISKDEANKLIGEIDKLAGKRIDVDISLTLDEAALTRIRQKLASTFGVVAGGGTSGTIIDFGNSTAAFAQGGIVDRETFARLAEGNKPEVVIPLTDPQRAVELASRSGLLKVLGDQISKIKPPPPLISVDQAGLAPNPGVDGSLFGPNDHFDPNQTESRRDFETLKSRIRDLVLFANEQLAEFANVGQGPALAARLAGLFNSLPPVEIQVDANTTRAQKRLDDLVEKFGIGSGVGLASSFLTFPGAARGAIIDHEQIIRVGERGRKEVIVPLEDPDRAFALLVATGLDRLVARGGTVAPTPSATIREAPRFENIHVHEVAGDPVATGIVAGRRIAAIVQEALI